MTHQLPDSTTRSGESGIALVIAMFMTLVLSVIASSLMFVSKSETISSASYKTMSQARYAAESGLHNAANHLLWTYVPPSTAGAAVADPIAAYVITGTTVTFNGAPVVLSSTGGSNYPIQSKRDAFTAAFANNTLALNPGNATYTAQARLVAMRQINDAMTGNAVTLQTWEITGRGRAGGLNAAEVEVMAIIERQDAALFKYAAFATDPGCDALTWGGGASTDSYDSRTYSGVGSPTFDAYGGDVGTNGSLTVNGNPTVIKGTLSTPRTGVGNCTGGNITALDANVTSVTGGILQLPQAVSMPTPPVINPLPPTGNVNFNGGCGAGMAAFCLTVAGVPTIYPALTGGTVTMADVRVQAGTNLHLKAGTYVVNSMSLSGNARITVDPPGTVVIKVAGVGSTTPLDFTGGGITNNSYDPSTLQFVYGGTGNVKLTGGSASAAVVYAPNAASSMSGGADFYGSIIAKTVTDSGGAKIHYDRNLQNMGVTAGNPMMGSFTWRTF